ncbi:MAG TPA: Rieske (2Fe-2S) protein [Candidatus Dormibacteraeota bacterium]|jgi:nitrite reductase/ring-hydroxylating ferredoxin subunit
MFEDLEGRIDRLVDGLLGGRRLKARVGDAAERDAIMAAAELAAAREGYPRMSPAFRRRLADALRAGQSPRLLTRRTALGAVAGLAAGAVGAAALSRLPQAPARPGVAGGVMAPAGGRWIVVALLSQLSETAPTQVVAGDQVAYLFRKGDQVTGVSAVCTHWPCALNWQAANSSLNCPCHNVNFTPEGRSANPNYEVPALPQFQVKVEDGRVSIFSL